METATYRFKPSFASVGLHSLVLEPERVATQAILANKPGCLDLAGSV